MLCVPVQSKKAEIHHASANSARAENLAISAGTSISMFIVQCTVYDTDQCCFTIIQGDMDDYEEKKISHERSRTKVV